MGGIIGGMLAGGVGVHVGKRVVSGTLRVIGALIFAKAKASPDLNDDAVALEIKKTTDDVADIIDKSEKKSEKEE